MNEFFPSLRARPRQLGVWLVLCLVSSVCQAEIYKWVDAEGRTHYSERKEDAGKAKVVGVPVSSQPPAERSRNTVPSWWQQPESPSGVRQASGTSYRMVRPAGPAKPKALSDGRSDHTDASRCNLARDVLSGAVRHPNGAPTDAYDRQVAESDIRLFCR